MSDGAERSQYVDIKDGMSRVMNNKGLYRRLLTMFLASEEFAKFDAALKAQDWPVAGDVAHAIKGMAGNLGLPLLADVGTRLMHSCRAGAPDMAEVDEYHDVYEKTIAFIREVADDIDSGAI